MPQVKPVHAKEVPAAKQKTNYPGAFASMVGGRSKLKLGDLDLTNFGVNITKLASGAISALFHKHSRSDELVYILEGQPTLYLGVEKFTLSPDQCIGFKAGDGQAHQLVNSTTEEVAYIEVGGRIPFDVIEYPQDDLRAELDDRGVTIFTRQDGSRY